MNLKRYIPVPRWLRNPASVRPASGPVDLIRLLFEADEAFAMLANQERSELAMRLAWADIWMARYLQLFPTLQSACDFA